MVILDFPKAVFGNTLSYYNIYFYFILSVKHGIFVVLLFCSYYYILVNLYFNLSILYLFRNTQYLAFKQILRILYCRLSTITKIHT